MSEPQWATPQQIRAMVHPLRMRILDALRTAGPSTATKLAARLGESSGATSYHLRVLADAKIIEEAPGLGKGRERWWRRVPARIWISTDTETPEEHSLTMASLAAYVQQDEEALRHFTLGFDALPREWREAMLIGSWRLQLTAEELLEFSVRILSVLDGMRRDEPGPPPGTREVTITLRALPSTTDDAAT